MRADAMRWTLCVMKAVSDPQRIRILMMLGRGELCVCQIVKILELAPSTVSKHLSILTAADLVVSRKDGRWAYYRLPDPAPGLSAQPVMDWIRDMVREDVLIRADRDALPQAGQGDPAASCRGRETTVDAAG